MSYLYGFSGKMRAGKDTAGDFVVDTLTNRGVRVYKMAFADTLKKLVTHAQVVCGFPVERDRDAYQIIGTDYARARDPEVWVRCLERKIAKVRAKHPHAGIAVTDVRFPNEVTALQALGFRIVRLDAHKDVRIERGAEPERMNHLSETALDHLDESNAWDVRLKNERRLSDFHFDLGWRLGLNT